MNSGRRPALILRVREITKITQYRVQGSYFSVKRKGGVAMENYTCPYKLSPPRCILGYVVHSSVVPKWSHTSNNLFSPKRAEIVKCWTCWPLLHIFSSCVSFLLCRKWIVCSFASQRHLLPGNIMAYYRLTIKVKSQSVM